MHSDKYFIGIGREGVPCPSLAIHPIAQLKENFEKHVHGLYNLLFCRVIHETIVYGSGCDCNPGSDSDPD